MADNEKPKTDRDLENDKGLFVESLTKARGVYLGDREVLETLIRNTVGNFCEYVARVNDEQAVRDKMKEYARELGWILLGRVDGYEPIRRWNEGGKIDRFCAKWLGSAETDPRKTMEHAIIQMFGEFVDIGEMAGDPVSLDEQWRWQIDATISRWVDLFIGIDPASQMVMDIGDHSTAMVSDDKYD